MEYWKSTPYLLSFMDRYKLSDRVRATVEADPRGSVAQLIRHLPSLQLDYEAMERRQLLGGGNGRMRALLRDIEESHLHRLLWLPPSISEYTLGRDFEACTTCHEAIGVFVVGDGAEGHCSHGELHR